ncbi:Retrovirus-related Pol Polyprotein from transposon TNT 1-94 [Phytophthora megakarya]|uniref:Retrovirus-related Pol Polyprotein from transposon TNT 1-94 n=1 Tax=Phytophthora megakarya TaxID=4795 RepID=A0A225WPE2_9STRA|nr:Retrovirus-related Pol Polyprotein from transposon TNT 1-94 [Phytophthora megakarya]
MSRSTWKDCWTFDSRTRDFTAWQIRIRALLEAEDVWDIMCGECVYSPLWILRRRQDFIARDKKAFHLLINSLDDATVKVMGKYQYSWSVYELMKRVYASKGTVSIYHARNNFHNVKYKGGEDMQSHINDLEETAETFARFGRSVDDEEKLMLMLGSLSESWKNLMMMCQNHDGLKRRDLQTKRLLEMDTRKHSHLSLEQQAHLASSISTEQHCECRTLHSTKSAHFG